jgi:hypothetical protein
MKTLAKFFLTLLVIKASFACTVSMENDTAVPTPLLIKPGTNQFFHPINNDRLLKLKAGESIELWCSGRWASPGKRP